jgi:ABC-type lipoprotein export system ATPase subunit
MTTDNALIRLEGLGKVFYTDEVETHALSDIHLEIKKGEYVAISGPSGCGKSTLLSILGLLDSPTGGSYSLNATPVQDLGAAQRARIRNREIGFAVARALVGEPSILLADEPTGNLDSRNGEAVMELLRDLHRAGSTICMVTHDNRFSRHAERTVHLFDGRVVSEEEAAQAAAEASAGKA